MACTAQACVYPTTVVWLCQDGGAGLSGELWFSCSSEEGATHMLKCQHETEELILKAKGPPRLLN